LFSFEMFSQPSKTIKFVSSCKKHSYYGYN
jgi:hypothetical protein